MLALIQMPAGKPTRLPVEWETRYGHLHHRLVAQK
jgi:hypothetical protein